MFFEVKNLCFSYYRKPLCLKDVSFSLKKYEKMVCISSKEMGKSTFLKVVSSFETSYFGQILLNGQELKKIKDEDKHFSLLTSDPVVFKTKSIRQNIDYFCEVNGLEKLTDEKLRNLLDEYGVDNMINQKMKSLSLLNLRKFAIMRAMLKNPNILFLDDQFYMLNEEEYESMKNIYLKLFSDRNLTIISTIGETAYRKIIDKLDKNIDKFFYLCNGQLAMYENYVEFEKHKDNIDVYNFLDDFEIIRVDILFENEHYKLLFDDKMSIISEKFAINFDKLKLENLDYCECFVVVKSDINLENIGVHDIKMMLETNKAKIYSFLGGEKLI